MTNPFEDEKGTYHVLINDEGQHSLWPSFIDVPKGWTIIHKSDTRAACLEFINKNWTDMRPNSLIESMKAQSASGQQEQPQPARRAGPGIGTGAEDDPLEPAPFQCEPNMRRLATPGRVFGGDPLQGSPKMLQ